MTGRVLVPYDRSEQAQHALTHAMTAFDSADIVLFHVVEPFADHTGAGGYDGERYRQQLENAEKMLSGVRDWFDESDRKRIKPVVRYGRAVHEIIRYTKDESIDHIVLGSHGRDGAARLLLGSVAETVARRSPVPVTVVRESAEELGEITHVLVPFDASDHAKTALEHAIETFPEATVTALYVTHPADGGIAGTATVFEILENWEDEVQEHIDSVLGVAETIADEHDAEILTETTDDRPAQGIVSYAEENEIDHIVLGSTGRDGLARVLLGSVAETVIRRSPVSVTVVR